MAASLEVRTDRIPVRMPWNRAPDATTEIGIAASLPK
jgi:hypothetical protein